jgi:hypothetical protein
LKPRLDLNAIERSLRLVQQDFDAVNATLDTPRDPLSDEVVSNLMLGYAQINTMLSSGIDPLTRGHTSQLMKLNRLILWGADESHFEQSARHIEETERRFYDDRSPGGVRALMGYLADHKDTSTWQRAAGAYIHILSQPQLFIEGNHRTGALVMSYILARNGKPPFVLTVENAKAYFDPSSLAKECRKRSIRSLFEVPKLRKRFASLLKDTTNPEFLTADR